MPTIPGPTTTDASAVPPDAGAVHVDDELRVLSLNLAHGRADRPARLVVGKERAASNLDLTADLLVRERPDVVGLQEVDRDSAMSGRFCHLSYLVDRTGFPERLHGDHAESVAGLRFRYGTALMSSVALRDAKSFRFGKARPLPAKGFVVGAVRWGDLDVDVVSLHLDPLRRGVRLRQAGEVARAMSDRGRPAIVMGDFNCEWDSPRSALRFLAEVLDLEPHALEGGPATFPATDRRLDWILTSPDLRCESYDVLDDRVSDHRAVRARIALR